MTYKIHKGAQKRNAMREIKLKKCDARKLFRQSFERLQEFRKKEGWENCMELVGTT